MFDTLAQRYGILPSKLLKHADSFDLMVLDVAMTYERMQQAKANKQYEPDLYDQDELQEIMNKTKKR